MKIKKRHLKTVAFAALGVVLGRGAQADTVLDFETLPPGQTQNAAMIQSFGDNVLTAREGISVNGFGTPNIGLTWQATGGRWDFYIDSVWAGAQLDSSQVGDLHEIVFAPNAAGASVVIKSFNFHPYYLSSERYTYDVTVVSGSSVVSGPVHVTFVADSAKHPVAINYTGAAGQALTLRLSRVASTLSGGEVEGGSGNIAIDDIVFAQLPEQELATGPSIVSLSPTNNQVALPPVPIFNGVITNGTSSVVGSSVKLSFNGVAVTPSVVQADGVTSVTYEASGLLPSLSSNRFVLSYNDDAAPAKSYTNQIPFSVASYVDKKLPVAIYSENFDSTQEGQLPAGWVSQSFNTVSAASDPSDSLLNLDSAAYTNWVVLDVSRFTGLFETYSQGAATPAGEASDYQRVLTQSPSNVVNGAYVKNLATGRMVFANSGYRQDTLGQVLYLYSPDFNLTGRSNVSLGFNSLWEQNQDSMALVEYSVNGGGTWLPVVYLLDQNDVITNVNGTVDPVLTFSTNRSDIAFWVDAQGATQGGYYGAFIGVASNQWANLAPFISKRVDDDTIGSKRVEVFRIPEADNKASVRFRFGHFGTDSWYFGIDNFGIYSLPPLAITGISRSGSNVVVTWSGSAGIRLQQSASLSAPDWKDVDGTDGASTATVATSGGQAFFRLIQN